MTALLPIRTALGLLVAACLLAGCRPPAVPDDFTTLKAFDQEISRMCGDGTGMKCFPEVQIGLANGHVTSIMISGPGMRRLPPAMYAFQQLHTLSLVETAFDSLPDLRALTALRHLYVEYNRFKSPLRLRQLPPSLETLAINRAGIHEVVVLDTLPNLRNLELLQNGGDLVNVSFCKLPRLESLDISAGCCATTQQQDARASAAKSKLCQPNVFVSAQRSFTD